MTLFSKMDGNSSTLTVVTSMLNMSNKSANEDLSTILSVIPTADDTEADVLNDETFGDCDLDTIKMKSDFDDNGEFLGNSISERSPDFFDSNKCSKQDSVSLFDNDDQSQQPSIDALLGEDPMHSPTTIMNFRQSTMNSFFNMAISQASNTHQGTSFSQGEEPHISSITTPSSQQQQQRNYQLLKQFEQMLINRQIPQHERIIYIRAMIEKMQRDTFNTQQVPQVKCTIICL